MLNVLDTLEALPCLSTHLEVSIPSIVKRSRRPSSALHAARAYMQRRKEKAESSWETHGLYDRTMKFFSLLDFSFGKNIEIV